MLLEPLPQPVVGRPLDHGTHRHVTQLRLGLTLKLRVGQLDRDDRGQALTDVLALKVGLLLLQVALLAGVPVERVGERLLEALLVHAAFDRVDAVGKAVQTVGVVAGVPLKGDLHLHRGTRRLLRVVVVAHVVEQCFFWAVDVHDEIPHAVLITEDGSFWFLATFVGKRNG